MRNVSKLFALVALLVVAVGLGSAFRERPRVMDLTDMLAVGGSADCEIAGDSRHATTMTAGEDRRVTIRVPSPATLRFAVGAPGRAAGPSWHADVRDAATSAVLWSEDIPAVDTAWADRAVDLRDAAMRNVVIHARVGTDRPGTVCWGDARLVPRLDSPPLVLLILLDTVRADHLSLFGYGRHTSPGLERLAADSVVFDDFVSDVSWTRGSVATLMTGLAAIDHGTLSRDAHLDRGVPVAERLGRHGMRSVAFSTNPNVLPFWGFGRGFTRFVDVDSARWTANADAARVLARAHEELTHSRGEPLFLYIHINDAHSPYDPPVADAERLLGSYDPNSPGRNIAETATPAEIAGAIDRYDAEIAHLDAELARFFDELRRDRLYDRALLVVVGDHGEEFLEHGGVYHGHTLFREQLHVPLLMKAPGRRRGSRTKARAAMPDVLPTMLALLGLAHSDLQGRILVANGEPTAGDTLPRYAVTDLDTNTVYAVDDGRRTLIVQSRPTSRQWLFDDIANPQQRTDLASSSGQGVVDELATLLNARLLPSRRGWHVRACGSGSASRAQIVVDAAERIERVEGFDLEPNDSAVVARDGKQLVVTLTLAPVPRTEESFGRLVTHDVPDRDEVVFATEGPFTVRASGDVPVRLGEAGTIATSPASVTVESAAATATWMPTCGNGAAIWIYDVGGAASTAPLDPDIRERLRQLGYIH